MRPEVRDLEHTAAGIIAELARRRLTIAVAESLTGGLLVAELIRPAGASAAVLGGVVAYDTELKASLLCVDPGLLAQHGAVHPDVAVAMAEGVRHRLAVAGRPADLGISTTGVAGPDQQDGHPAGTVYVGLSFGTSVAVKSLALTGSRDTVREETVTVALRWISETLERGLSA